MTSNPEFIPLGIAVVVVSDTRDLQSDTSGALLCERVVQAGHNLIGRTVVKDEVDEIVARLRALIADEAVAVVLTTGGTGLTQRDVTPEAFREVVEKEIPGFGELFRWLSFSKIGTTTIHSRATAGVANKKLLFALPGSRSAVRDAWDDILVHQLDARHQPSNFVDLLSRL
jgi:molybdenum cofactor biosynthesis protein B